MALTKNDIVNLLATNDKAVCRALVVLNNRQTHDEQRAEHTKYNNGRGFRPAHARMGTSMADFYTRNGYLSPKQIAYWRRPMKDGNMRLAIYWAQLSEEAEKKAEKKAATAPVDDFNQKWAEFKNEYARREAEQEQLAFEWKLQNR